VCLINSEIPYENSVRIFQCQKYARKTFLNRQFGMRVYMKLVTCSQKYEVLTSQHS
jgi:hypothetical protein